MPMIWACQKPVLRFGCATPTIWCTLTEACPRAIRCGNTLGTCWNKPALPPAPANKDATGSHDQSRVIAPDGNIVREATIFGAEVVTAMLDLSKATGGMAQRSIDRSPLGDWWRESVKKVRLID